jgi:hypothetical protein
MEYTWNEVTEKKTAKNSQKNADAKTWRGETDGESVFGEVKEFKEVTRKDGTTTHVLNLFNEVFNEWYTIWCKGMLLRKLEAAQVEPGKVVKIEFEGFKPLKSDPDKNYRSYKVYVANEA